MTDRLSPSDLAELERLCAAGDRACIDGTPMIPLHKDTVRKLLSRIAELEAALREAHRLMDLGFRKPFDHLGGCLFKADQRMPCQCNLTGRIRDFLAEALTFIDRRAALPEEKPHG
jgi:hypothetical protein